MLADGRKSHTCKATEVSNVSKSQIGFSRQKQTEQPETSKSEAGSGDEGLAIPHRYLDGPYLFLKSSYSGLRAEQPSTLIATL